MLPNFEKISFSWIMPVVANQFSIITSYRFDFWMKFIGKTLATFFASYFIWSSIFEDRSMEPLNGYTFTQMLYYSLLAPLVYRISIGDEFVGIEEDVFGGSLNRYLVLPLPYGFYKLVVFMTRSLMSMAQGLLLLVVVDLLDSGGLSPLIAWHKVFLGLIVALGGGILYFLIAGILEMVSFWQDQVWNLIVGTRFIIYFSSGLMIPLSFYPPWIQDVILMTPFPYLVGIPVQIIFTENTLSTNNIIIYFLWLAILSSCFSMVWTLGKKRYSGIGI